jgi:N-acylneuraminate cytidylyltransferase
MNENEKKPLCFIPARGGSKRILRKNIALLQGKPLIAWTIDSAKQSELFDKLYVSSDDDEILKIAENFGACPLERRTDLAGDRVTLLELCLKEVEKICDTENYTDLYLLLPTTPFRKSSTIREAWENYIRSDADTLLSIVPCDYPPQWTLRVENNSVSPLYPSEYQQLRQDLTSAFIHDGGHLITKISSLAETKSFIGSKTLPFYVAVEEAVDIDEPMDLLWAEFILNNRNNLVSA